MCGVWLCTNGQNVKAVAATIPAPSDPVIRRTNAHMQTNASTNPTKTAKLCAAIAFLVTMNAGRPSTPATRLSSEYASVPVCG